MTASQAGVVNEALEQIAAQTTITDLNDGSPVGNAAGLIYVPITQMLIRQLDPDFARRTVTLVATGNTPPVPYGQEYSYPADCIRTRQVRPASTAYDTLDPQPVRWAVANDVVSGLPAKVILTNLTGALLVYSTSLTTELQWDPVFRQVVVARLAVPLSMAVGGRPDFAVTILDEARKAAEAADARDDGV